jgi:hypothetical protein
MRRVAVTLLIFCSGWTVWAQSERGQKEMVEKAHQVASEQFNDRPDFIATQTVRRQSLTKNSNSWKTQDTLTMEVSLAGGKEQFKLLAINGKSTTRSKDDLGGMKISGEFGSTVWRVFDPKTETRFKWERSDRLQSQTVDVFSYNVEKDHSAYAYDFHDGHKGSLAYGGLLYIDRDSYRTLKVTYSADSMPADWPLTADSGAVDYSLVEIGEKQFLMPQHAEWVAVDHKGNQLRNVTEFSNYHKFFSDTKIDFQKQ